MRGDAAGLPRITVVTPSYNQGRFLEHAVRSVLGQGYPGLEYIVMDGGSTDGSADIIRRYTGVLTHWASERDGGQSDAINRGLAKGTGEILAWLNSDDAYLPGALWAVGEYFRAHPRAEVVYGSIDVIDEDGRVIGEERLIPFSSRALFFETPGLPQPAVFWRRDLFVAVGGLDVSMQYSMDYDLFVRFALRGARFEFLRRKLAAFRLHRDSKGVANGARTRQAASAARFRHLRIDDRSAAAYLWRRLYTVRKYCLLALQGDLGYVARHAGQAARRRLGHPVPEAGPRLAS